MQAWNPTIETNRCGQLNMGKTGQSIGMVLCFVLAIISQMYSNEINDIFKFDVSGPVDTSAPLVGLQTNESWFVVLVDFQSNQLNNDDKEPIESEFQEYSREYFSQALGQEVNVNITIHDEIIRAPKPLSAYGDDGPYGRDYGDGTEFLPAILAQHVVESVDTTTLSDFDLNDDGVVDRFLILHSTLAQEQGSGSSNRIWSHFTSFSEPIKNGDVTFEHYTMSSMRHGINGFGTILHEMMHQFGAYDLYPVHDSGYSGSWKGIGVWDIMASGNWNGGGDTPSLPTGPTMAAIGHASTREVSLEWPANSPSPCIGPVIALDDRTNGGDRIRIQVSDDEFIWIEKRVQQGYDSSLPGEGVLVLFEDFAAGDSLHNAMNIDQRRPYLKTIEADGNQEQLRGVNDGVASDLFQPGDEFGERGILIRDHDGILVPWHVRIVEEQGQWNLEFHSTNCSPSTRLDFEDFGTTLLQEDQLVFEQTPSDSSEPCWGTLDGSDGRQVIFTNDSAIGSKHYGTFSKIGMLDSTATFAGIIQCGDDVFDVQTSITTLGSIPLPVSMRLEATIPVVESSTLSIPYIGEGIGSAEYTIEIEGPLARIATAEPTVEIENGNGTIVLNIEPRGLLQDNMFVMGTVHLQSFNGESWTIDVELRAVEEERIPLIGDQSFVLTLFFLIFSVWFATSLFARTSSKKGPEQMGNHEAEEFLPGDHL